MTMVQTSHDAIDFSVARPGTNVVLVAEGKEIHVNKEFLASFSPYFNTLLLSPNFSEYSSPHVEIDHDYNQLLKCIQIVYQTGPLPKGDMYLDDVIVLMTSADRFDLPVVRRFCELELIGKRYCTESIDAYLLASHYKLKEAKELILDAPTSNEHCKMWYESGPYVPHPLSVHEMDLHLTPADLHQLIFKVIKAIKEK